MLYESAPRVEQKSRPHSPESGFLLLKQETLRPVKTLSHPEGSSLRQSLRYGYNNLPSAERHARASRQLIYASIMLGLACGLMTALVLGPMLGSLGIFLTKDFIAVLSVVVFLATAGGLTLFLHRAPKKP